MAYTNHEAILNYGVNKNVNFTLQRAMKAQRRSRDIALLFL
jgi:hypothetical protein